MKVVLFCGGLGTRLREFSETIPKPMVDIGYRPLIWHLMKYYAYYGHKDFILCLGYRGDYIKQYFLHYDECLSNNFALSKGGRSIHLFNSDIADWNITFIDTGLNSNIGQRLLAAEPYLGEDEVFMANYSDGLCDLNLEAYVDHFYAQDKVASFLAVKPSQSFHHISHDESGVVTDIGAVDNGNFWINGGYFIFKRQIFDYLREGEELVEEPFRRLIAERQLTTYRNPGFWACMDTFKEKKLLDDLYASGTTPWTVWEQGPPHRPSQLAHALRGGRSEPVDLDRSHLVAHYHR